MRSQKNLFQLVQFLNKPIDISREIAELLRDSQEEVKSLRRGSRAGQTGRLYPNSMAGMFNAQQQTTAEKEKKEGDTRAEENRGRAGDAASA